MRNLFFVLGSVFLGLGVIGIALPVVPTVPFLLVAAWAFAKSSPRLRRKIVRHPVYGPPIRAWQERGAIAPLAKLWAVGAMGVGVALSYVLGIPPWLVATQFGVCMCISVFVVTRPSE
jgi:uncharacterized membrane protein YbaN (DUF454 family)